VSVRITDVHVHPVPQLTLRASADATELALFGRDLGGSVTDVLVAAAGRALAAHPEMCVNVEERQAGPVVVRVPPSVGVAVATGAGLLVPVVRNAAGAPLADVRAEAQRVVAAARDGCLAAADTGGAATTVSYLELGLGAFPAVVNPPQASILVVEPASLRSPTLSVTLSVDTRALDESRAACFLATVTRLLERPYRRLL